MHLLLAAVLAAAPAGEWWSLQPLGPAPVPAVRNAAWVRNPIDAFVLAALEAKGLSPSPPADRPTLLRRVTFDLTGLPPTPAELSAFVADTRPDAYERVVERLLSSPAHAERMARHWLDVARYADTHGYDKDKRRDAAWPYRDWVVRAMAEDLPYAEFVRRQIAGDVILRGDPAGLDAVGFLVAGPWDFVGQVELREGTVDKEKTRLVDRDDLLTAAVTGFMSLTVGCARCHDHKFDPIPAKDYYRLQAVFSGVERGNRPRGGSPTEAAKALHALRDALRAERARLDREAAALTSPESARIDADRKRVDAALAALPAPPTKASPTNGYHSAIFPTADHTRWVQIDLGESLPIDEIRLYPARPVDFPDTPGFGFPVRYRVEAGDDPTFAKGRVLSDRTAADVANPGDNPVIVSGKSEKARYVRVTATRLWKRTGDYVFALGEIQVESGGRLVSAGKAVSAADSIEAGRWARKHLVDGFDSRRSLPDLSDAKSREAFAARRKLLAEKASLDADRARVAAALLPASLKERQAKNATETAKVEAALKTASAGPQVYTVVSVPPRKISRLYRGDVEQPREEVSPGGLSCVTGVPDVAVTGEGEGARRLALADWIAHRDNPLTWRSAVNRLWQTHFGRGIVDTPNDFGKMGGLPSHPALLDHLAGRLRDTGSMRDVHRLIVTSATYRQASGHRDGPASVDADNRLLWRMNRTRLDAESLRDAVLATSGALDRTMGGKGYDLFRFKDDHSPIYDHADKASVTNPATYRRTVYRFTVRSVPNPFLDCLDCADPNQSTPVRNATLTPLQALALLNNPFMVSQAAIFGRRVESASVNDGERARLAVRLAFGREATGDEADAVAAHAKANGWAAACRVLLNANEFVFVD